MGTLYVLKVDGQNTWPKNLDKLTTVENFCFAATDDWDYNINGNVSLSNSVTSNVAASNAGGQGAASAISNNAAVTTNNTNMNSPSSLGLVNNNTSKVSNATSEYHEMYGDIS